jgi:hypothetical protein
MSESLFVNCYFWVKILDVKCNLGCCCYRSIIIYAFQSQMKEKGYSPNCKPSHTHGNHESNNVSFLLPAFLVGSSCVQAAFTVVILKNL